MKDLVPRENSVDPDQTPHCLQQPAVLGTESGVKMGLLK